MYAPCREHIYVFRNPSICSDFDCSARLQVLPPPVGGGAPEGRRERKNRQFLPENIRFFLTFNFSLTVSFARKTFGNPPYLSLSGSAAAPPSGGAKPWPCRAARPSQYVSQASAACSPNPNSSNPTPDELQEAAQHPIHEAAGWACNKRKTMGSGDSSRPHGFMQWFPTENRKSAPKRFWFPRTTHRQRVGYRRAGATAPRRFPHRHSP